LGRGEWVGRELNEERKEGGERRTLGEYVLLTSGAYSEGVIVVPHGCATVGSPVSAIVGGGRTILQLK